MYLQFFGLREAPFSLTPDTQFFVDKKTHRHALNTILLALRHSEGFIKIVGEVGTGKTLICRKLLSCIGKNFITSYIPNPSLTPDELKAFVAQEIGADYSAEMPAHQLMVSIYRRLLQLARRGMQVVLVVDEAQAVPRETIESLRLLTNLETEKRKLLQIVLIGQPELDNLLNRPDLRQLKQRIVFSEYLQPFSTKETANYVRSRLASAGKDDDIFSTSALWLIALASKGIPRLINILCHKSLLAAYGRGDYEVTTYHVATAIVDTDETTCVGKLLSWRWHLLWPALGGVSALLVVMLMPVMLQVTL